VKRRGEKAEQSRARKPVASVLRGISRAVLDPLFASAGQELSALVPAQRLDTLAHTCLQIGSFSVGQGAEREELRVLPLACCVMVMMVHVVVSLAVMRRHLQRRQQRLGLTVKLPPLAAAADRLRARHTKS
jgi:hypothetical protein